MKHIKPYNEDNYFSVEEVADIKEIFKDIADGYDLNDLSTISNPSDFAKSNFYKIKISSTSQIDLDDFLNGVIKDKVKGIQISLSINDNSLEEIIPDIANFNQRMVNMGFNFKFIYEKKESTGILSKTNILHLYIKKGAYIPHAKLKRESLFNRFPTGKMPGIGSVVATFTNDEVNDIMDVFRDLREDYLLKRGHGLLNSYRNNDEDDTNSYYSMDVLTTKNTYMTSIPFQGSNLVHNKIFSIQITLLINKEILEEFVVDLINFSQRLINMGHKAKIEHIPQPKDELHFKKYTLRINL